MRRLFLGVVIGLAACSAPTAPATTTPTATSTIPPAQLVDGGLIPVDPATLVPVPDSEPLVVADSHFGVVSPNGRWAAILSQTTGARETTTLSLVDLETVTVVNQDEAFAGRFTVDDTGTAYWLVEGESTRLAALSPDGPAHAVPSDFPSPFRPWSQLELLDEGLLGVVGTDGAGTAVALVVDLAMETVGTFPTQVESDDGNPDAVWDGDRILIVEAVRDVVTEIDLESGELFEHPWERPESRSNLLLDWLMPAARAKEATTGITRNAALFDGALFVVTTVDSVEDEVWSSNPEELVVIDTDVWDVETLDLAVNSLFPSPDGTLLLAQGVSHSDLLEQGIPGPLYIIDPTTREVLAELDIGGDHLAQVSFSADGTLAYAQYWDEQETIDLIDLGLLQIVGSVAFREMSHIGPAGLLAFHIDQG